MELSQGRLLGLLLNPFGRAARSVSLLEGGVAVGGALVPFANISAAPLIRNGLLSSTFVLQVDCGDTITLRGAVKSSASAFGEATEAAWRRYNLIELEREAGRIDALLTDLGRLGMPAVYPSACTIGPILAQAQDIEGRLIRKLRPEAVGEDNFRRLAPIRDFIEDPSKARATAIDAFVEAELGRWQQFFDTVEAKPLTFEQRLSIVVDEDATLVLAGAGSGKTSVITAKAAYLLKAGIRTADEILLLAFAKDAATEMSERIEARCGAPILTRTFHALAYDIIGAVDGSKPPLAPHATDDVAFLDLIRQILKDLVASASEIARAIISWFTHFLIEPRDDTDYKTKHDWYMAVEKLDLRTLQGDQVKSYEELQIANWLYENGVAYTYEPVYEHDVASNGKREYTPDFHLTESGIYIEHFGVRRERQADGGERLMTAPFVNREEYLAGMEWKREVHKKNGTILIETFSYERQEGRLLDALAAKLAPHVALRPRPLATIFERVIEMG